MKKIYLYILPLVLIFAACNSEEDNLVSDQQTRIENFLNSYDESEHFDGIYRLRTVREEGNYNRTRSISYGDIVHFDYAGYQFTTQRIEPSFYTNRDFIIDQLKETGITELYWNLDREVITVGQGKVIKSLEEGLVGCYEGDSVRIFLTTDKAYGANYISHLPPNSAVEYVVWIEKVEKQ